jgi:AcrR family transcriptional regulator
MARSYELKERAQRQEQTRQRIVEAAIALHGQIGPARTTVSAIAERAGVERHTYYRHFPDERSLHLACSGMFFELNPLPDPAAWQSITGPRARLRRGLSELYGYYTQHEALLAHVDRDAPIHPLTAEVIALRVTPLMGSMRQTLAEALATGPQRRRVLAAVDLALAFPTWHTLKSSGLRTAEAANLMARTVLCASSSE